jgi:prepilin-type N-terminal cleavage/methylation domain-containing protein
MSHPFFKKPMRITGRFWRSFTSLWRDKQGFTLAEVVVTMVIALLIMSLAFGAFFTISGMINRMEVESERRVDLSRAFDFLTAEIRSAQRVNSTASVSVAPLSSSSSSVGGAGTGAGASMASVLTSAGLNPANFGSTPVLYLEVPFSTPPTSACPADGLTYDRVVYDIRPNPTHWLGPRVISRYGRVPTSEGAIDPCRSPVANDVLVDNITESNPSPLPTCTTGTQTGAGGFYACVNNGLVQLTLKSKVVDLKTQDIDSKALSRPGLYALKPTLTLVPSTGSAQLSWTWAGTSGVGFKVYRVAGGDRIEISDSNNTDLSAVDSSPSPSVQNCYTVVATSNGYTSEESNSACYTP